MRMPKFSSATLEPIVTDANGTAQKPEIEVVPLPIEELIWQGTDAALDPQRAHMQESLPIVPSRIEYLVRANTPSEMQHTRQWLFTYGNMVVVLDLLTRDVRSVDDAASA